MKYIANVDGRLKGFFITEDKHKARIIYKCDPNKNCQCNKEWCNDRACRLTLMKEWSLDGIEYVTEVTSDAFGNTVFNEVPLHEN